jgi:hypothetical protein
VDRYLCGVAIRLESELCRVRHGDAMPMRSLTDLLTTVESFANSRKQRKIISSVADLLISVELLRRFQ